MTADLPQSIAPAVAFDIPVEKKVSESPPVQKRLQDSANSPRKSFSLNDIVQRLTQAGKRREDAVSAKKPKKSSPITKPEEVDIELETRIAAKLSSANARREEKAVALVQKLSGKNKDKLDRGSKALSEVERSAKELDEQLRVKEETAEKRREEMLASKVCHLGIVNGSKQKRGQLAMELSSIEAQHKENQLNQKLLSATHRREMAGLFKAIDQSDAAAEKEDRVELLRHKEDILASNRAIAIEEKLKYAEEKRAKAIAASTQQLSQKTNDKLLRGADALKEQTVRSKLTLAESEMKIERANDRREKVMQQQLETSSKASSDKEARKEKQLALLQAELKVKEKTMHTKLLDANMRKETMLLEKSTKIGDQLEKTKSRAQAAAVKELEEMKSKRIEVNNRLKEASARKEKLMMESTKETRDNNKSKVEKVEQFLAASEANELQKYADIQNRLAVASAKREREHSKLSSTSKKRVASPKPSPTKSAIEARINKAASRREMYLLSRIDKASISTSKKLSPRSDLFSKVTPRTGDEDRVTTSPRISAHRGNESNKDVGHFTMMPIIATSVIALALIGVVSFWKQP